jgi:hypothetical protein
MRGANRVAVLSVVVFITSKSVHLPKTSMFARAKQLGTNRNC